MLKKKRDCLFNVAILELDSIFVLYKWYLPMSVSKSKNLERKLDNFAKEAKNELNNVCGSSLWAVSYTHLTLPTNSGV